jgi:3-deoxy-7-phosphoheptulonate synthase
MSVMADELFADGWTPESWRTRRAEQQPEWPDAGALDAVLEELRRLPPLVFAGEARTLTSSLEAAHNGDAFLLIAGDCAESFDLFSADAIRDKLRVILQMSVVLTYGSGVPTIKVGRLAGQFSKPRSSPTETRDGVTLPSFRGDTVNDFAFDAAARRADPTRLFLGYINCV